jgi:hypothetical protein
MKINILIVTFFLLSSTTCAHEELSVKSPIQNFDENLERYLFSKYDDFQITEIFSKNDAKKIFLKKSLGESLVKGTIDLESREILFKELPIKTESHVGIAVLIYADEQAAKNALKTIENSGYFENTKILTKYISANKGNINVILYTESSADKVVLDYIEHYFER